MANKSIFEEIRNDPTFSIENSRNWFQKRIQQLNIKSGDSRILYDKTRRQQSIVPGSLYLYEYDPKYKDKLPFYDMFPLAFIFDVTSTHMMGINFHYLPLNIRIQLFDQMVQFATNKSLTDKARIRMNWSLVNNLAKMEVAKPAVKQYLKSHVRTMPVRIPIQDWKTALLLPFDNFVGATNKAVWRDSALKLRKKP